MVGMADKPDGYFDLAIVDPPYGIGMNGGITYQRPSRPNSYGKPPKHQKKEWDNKRPCKKYFDELFRVSQNQIIFGANYFTEYLTPSMGWIYWGKMEDESNFSDGELIFTSYERALKSIKIHQFHGTNGGKDRIHPTQKPIALYDWILQNYATKGQSILDTHVGSGSSRIAAYKGGFNFTGFEIDPEYYALQEARFREFVMNIAPADLEPVTRHGQIKLF
jgi:site-specific DNA-methyltransferase (adenine-specific)